MHKYKQQARQMKGELLQAEHSFKARCFFRRKTQDGWAKTCMLERELAAEQGSCQPEAEIGNTVKKEFP